MRVTKTHLLLVSLVILCMALFGCSKSGPELTDIFGHIERFDETSDGYFLYLEEHLGTGIELNNETKIYYYSLSREGRFSVIPIYMEEFMNTSLTHWVRVSYFESGNKLIAGEIRKHLGSKHFLEVRGLDDGSLFGMGVVMGKSKNTLTLELWNGSIEIQVLKDAKYNIYHVFEKSDSNYMENLTGNHFDEIKIGNLISTKFYKDGHGKPVAKEVIIHREVE